MSQRKHKRSGELLEKKKLKVKRPPRYQVIFHNDDYTTQDFVVEMLKTYFHKKHSEAVHLMLTIHKTGSGVAGVYPRDIAETKRAQVEQRATSRSLPLRLSLKEDE